MKQLGLYLYVFYSQEQDRPVTTESQVIPFATGRLSVPEQFSVPELTGDECRDSWLQLLGHCTLQPRGVMIGALAQLDERNLANSRASMLEILLRQRYKADTCYALKTGDPFANAVEQMEEIHEKFRVGPASRPSIGPLNGSIIVERTAYAQFQIWFSEIVNYYAGNSLNGAAHSALRPHELGRFLEQCIAYYFGQKFRGKVVSVKELVLENAPNLRLASVVNQVKLSNRVIVAFAHSAYDKALANWIAAMRRVGVSNVMIFALDEITCNICRDLAVQYYSVNAENANAEDVMRIRIEMFRELCRLRVNFVHSDLDAIWLRNPLDYLAGLPGDLLISTGTTEPADLYEQWGFTLCTGFFEARASKRMEIFFGQMLDDDQGDQVSLNYVLFEDNFCFETGETYSVEIDNTPVDLPADLIFGSSDNFSIQVLPHKLFQRLPNSSKEAFVKHPQTPEAQEEKLAALRKIGCYFLA